MDLQINLLIIENLLFFFHSIKFQTQFLIAIFRDICEIVCLLEFISILSFSWLAFVWAIHFYDEKNDNNSIKRTLFFGNCCCKWRKMRCFFSRSLMLVGTLTTNEEKKITLCEYYCYFTFHSFECVRFGVTFTHYTNTIHWCDAYQKPYGFNIGHSIATDGAVYPKTHRFIVNNQPSHNILSIKIYFYSTNVWVFFWTLIDLIKLKANKNNVRFLYLILLK